MEKQNTIGLAESLALAAGALFIFTFYTQNLGAFGISITIFSLVTCRSFLTLIISLFNFSLSIAFDYYLRVWDYGYGFYDGAGISVAHLCLVSNLVFIYILFLDRSFSFNARQRWNEISLPSLHYKTSNILYYPLLLSVIWCTFFILKNAGSMFSNTFELEELRKYSFLEYYSVIIFFLLRCSVNRYMGYTALVSCLLLTSAAILASYRMVSIIYVMAILLALLPGHIFKRSLILLGWAGLFIALASVSYIRGGDADLNLQKLLGYKEQGYLDNTFSGVIETSLIYTSIQAQTPFFVRIQELIGTLLPLPGFLIPDNMIYYNNLDEKYHGRIPGGGIIAGFIIYFDYLLLPFILLYLYVVYKNLNKVEQNNSCIFTGMIFVSFVSISRWWLYGPYVLFKLLGIFLTFHLINYAARGLERNV